MDVDVINQKFDYRDVGGIHVYPLFTHEEDEMLGSHWHEELELVYSIRGNNNHYINGEHYVVSPGQLVVVNSDFVHSIVPQEEIYQDSALKAVVIIISKAFLDVNFAQYERIYFTNESRNTTDEMDRLIMEILLCADGTTDEPGIMLHRNAMIMELLYHLCRTRIVRRESVDRTQTQQSVEKIKEIVTYIETHYAEHLSREQVAAEFYLSPNYFSTYFKKYVGRSFIQYLTDFRVEKARNLLLNTDRSVGQIAEECGFTDDRSLIVAFRQKFHNTPLQYRKLRTKS